MICQQCGTRAADTATFCAHCGAALAVPGGPAVTGAGDAVYASFGARALALVIDSAILWSVSFAIIAIAGRSAPAPGAGSVTGRIAGTYLLVMLLWWLYFAVLESSARQATPGKRALGIKVTSLAGERIGFGRASARYFARFLNSVTLNTGYLLALFTRRQQALHDLVARTLVAVRECEAATIRDAGGRRGRPGSGLLAVAIGAAVTLPVIGMLAAIAIPAYQDYTIRAQVNEGLVLADGIKRAVADFHARHDRFPTQLAATAGSDDALGYPGATTGRYVTRIDTASGGITIYYGNGANPLIAGKSLGINAAVRPNGEVVWFCGYNTAVPQDSRIVGGAETSLDARFLPGACRA